MIMRIMVMITMMIMMVVKMVILMVIMKVADHGNYKDGDCNWQYLYEVDEVLFQDYGKFKLESESGVYGTKKNRYYFDRVQSDS